MLPFALDRRIIQVCADQVRVGGTLQATQGSGVLQVGGRPRLEQAWEMVRLEAFCRRTTQTARLGFHCAGLERVSAECACVALGQLIPTTQAGEKKMIFTVGERALPTTTPTFLACQGTVPQLPAVLD